METRAVAVGRLGSGGEWVGFAPTAHGYAIVLGVERELLAEQRGAEADTLLTLAIAHFEEALGEVPEELAATHGDVAALVRHIASSEADSTRRELLAAAVDAIDDGLAADVVSARLTAALNGPAARDPIAHLLERARHLDADR